MTVAMPPVQLPVSLAELRDGGLSHTFGAACFLGSDRRCVSHRSGGVPVIGSAARVRLREGVDQRLGAVVLSLDGADAQHVGEPGREAMRDQQPGASQASQPVVIGCCHRGRISPLRSRWAPGGKHQRPSPCAACSVGSAIVGCRIGVAVGVSPRRAPARIRGGSRVTACPPAAGRFEPEGSAARPGRSTTLSV